MIFFRGFHFLKFNHKSQKFFFVTKKDHGVGNWLEIVLLFQMKSKDVVGQKILSFKDKNPVFLQKNF